MKRYKSRSRSKERYPKSRIKSESLSQSEKDEKYKYGESSKKIKKEHNDSCHSSDTDEELLFNWEDHRYDVNKLFFSNDDLIKAGSSDHDDFWKFLLKYQGLQKQKKVRDMCDKMQGTSVKKEMEYSTSIFNLPKNFDKRYNVNFALNTDVDRIRSRLPPRELQEKRLSRKKMVELKLVLTLYIDFIQRQRFETLRKLRESQRNLPIAAHREEILETLSKNNVVVLAGDTGCGKSTQVSYAVKKILP